MRYLALPSRNASRVLEALRRGEVVPEEAVDRVGSGAPLEHEAIRVLERELAAIRSKYPERLRKRDPRGGRFEAEAAS